MSTRPMRKTYRRPDLGIVHAANELGRHAAEIELGWLNLRQHLHDAGWPASTPEDDRRAKVREDGTVRAPDPDCYDDDHADPTGEQALHLDRLHRDLDKLQDLRYQLEHCTKTLVALTRKHLPEGPACIPVCSVKTCDAEVEKRVSAYKGTVTYRGMELIAGAWVAQVGVAPTCARHGRADRRDAVA